MTKPASPRGSSPHNQAVSETGRGTHPTTPAAGVEVLTSTADAAENYNRLKPAMPCIPGVNGRQAEQEKTAGIPRSNRMRMALPLAATAALALGAAIAWRASRAPGTPPPASLAYAPTAGATSPSPAGATPAVPIHDSTEVATLQELAKPWSSKTFLFRRRLTNETVPAMVVHLPSPASRGALYWAFSLQPPFGHCELEYVTDLSRLASQYGYRASHPMVGDPCAGTLYDPLRLGTLAGGAWARGEVVQGSGIRPPIGIEVRVEGSRLVAVRIE